VSENKWFLTYLSRNSLPAHVYYTYFIWIWKRIREMKHASTLGCCDFHKSLIRISLWCKIDFQGYIFIDFHIYILNKFWYVCVIFTVFGSKVHIPWDKEKFAKNVGCMYNNLCLMLIPKALKKLQKVFW